MKQHTETRREFLATAAAGAALLAAPAVVRGQNLNSRIQVAQIGTGSRAGGHLDVLRYLRTQEDYPLEIVAACDVYRPRMENRRKQFQIARGTMDYREILAMPDVDAVFIATPPSWLPGPGRDQGGQGRVLRKARHSLAAVRADEEAGGCGRRLGSRVPTGDPGHE